jgi:hypothetical protein
MNIYLGVNTLNQFQSYSTPYPTETPIVRLYEHKPEVDNPVYEQAPVMVTAQVVQPVQQPQHAQVSELLEGTLRYGVVLFYMCDAK